MSATAFIFLTTSTRIHLAAWNPDDRRWEVPCGRITPPGGHSPGRPTINLDKPICKTCDKLTRQITDAELIEYRLA